MFCANCGNQIPDDSRFCPACGAGLGDRSGNPQIDPAVYSGEPVPPSYRAGPEKKKKKTPGFLIVYLFLLAAFVGVVVVLLKVKAEKEGPLHGAKIKNKVIWETEGLTVTAKGLYYDRDDGGAPHYILLEAKNTGSGDSMLKVEAAAVNSVMVDSELALLVPAGGEAEGKLRLFGRELESLAALDEMFSISIILREDNHQLLSEVINLETGLKAHEIYMNTGEDAPQYEGEGIVVNYASFYPMFSDYGPALEFYVENNTDRNIRVKSMDVSVNGSSAESREADDIFLPHTRGYILLVPGMEQLERDDLLPIDVVTSAFEFYDFSTGETLLIIPVNVDRP